MFKNLKRTDILGENGERLGALFGVYLLHLKQDGGKHYAVGKKLDILEGGLLVLIRFRDLNPQLVRQGVLGFQTL